MCSILIYILASSESQIFATKNCNFPWASHLIAAGSKIKMHLMTQLSQLLCSELIGKIFNFCPIFIEICSRARGVIPSNVAGDGGGGLPLNITIFYCIAPGARSLHLRIQCLEFIKIAFLARS